MVNYSRTKSHDRGRVAAIAAANAALGHGRDDGKGEAFIVAFFLAGVVLALKIFV